MVLYQKKVLNCEFGMKTYVAAIAGIEIVNPLAVLKHCLLIYKMGCQFIYRNFNVVGGVTVFFLLGL